MNNLNSPCIGSCSLDGDKICRGCFRQIDEILQWGKATDPQKIKILADSRARQKEFVRIY
ncbi:hypothetical protein DUF1289 [Psychromonas ingrahamii 37]|uniref:Fe-S protein n=1 Tax=Psychromonas ingrahamii (strain DSM 17664 / CCUG 51855 / 37) TaxID=357804 RepID=A1T0P5_PSYIN|nr:DUF1289 domain-containing protein [Psychromonas ingrahamii]ABM05310.1 hypothetical protein DUF1289 [Psychromonas ingrahamii 37]